MRIYREKGSWFMSKKRTVTEYSIVGIIPKGNNISDIKSCGLQIAEYLYDQTSHGSYLSDKRTLERIKGAYFYPKGGLDAKIIDCAIGFLHVLDAYRRQGYAYALTVYLIQQLRQQGKIPFVHIEETNAKSLRLAMKLGFQTDRRVHWFETG